MLGTLAACILLTAQSPAQDKTYPLEAGWSPVKGHRTELTTSVSLKVDAKSRGTPVESTSLACQLTAQDVVLSGLGAEALLFQRKILKASYLEQGKAQPLTFVGANLRLEFTKGQVTFEREDQKPLSENENDLLNRVSEPMDLNRFLDPEKPVKIGESWATPAGKGLEILLGPSISAGLALQEAKARMTLKAVDTRGGAEFARVEGVLEVPMSSMGEATFKRPIPMKITLEATFDVDGKVPDRTWKFKLAGKGASPIQGIQGVEGVVELEVAFQKDVSLKTLK